MKKAFQFLSLFAALAMFSPLSADQSKAFEEIMKKGFKGSKENPPLLKKVMGGSATKEEKAKLAEYLRKMATSNHPKAMRKAGKKKRRPWL